MICKRSLDEPSYCRGTPALIFLLVAPLALIAALVLNANNPRSASPATALPPAGGAAATAGDGRATAGLVPTS